MKERILVTGAYGQIGTELVLKLREIYGETNVIASDIAPVPAILEGTGPSMYLDVTDKQQVSILILEQKITRVFHLAAILSSKGELNPQLCWNLNMLGLLNVLEAARKAELKQVITPSSIAVFGPDTPKDQTPNKTILRPTSMYGITKVSGELLGEYYNLKFGMDTRSLRYPGLVSSAAEPGGGTTDYAVDMYVKAAAGKPYECFVSRDTVLPFMYMPDALKAILELAHAPEDSLVQRSFNVAAFSCSAAEIEESIKKHHPDFKCTYKPDFRQNIADSWPRSIDDSDARKEWSWKHEYNLEEMTKDMLKSLKGKE